MTEVINVRFRSKGKVYYFDPAGMSIEKGQAVIVETAKGLEYGDCTLGNHEVPDELVVQPLRPVVRIATEEDRAMMEKNRAKEKEAFSVCQSKIAAHGLDMKLVDVEYNFEGSKILFFFTSDGRVDFRELVKDLASVFRTRIELRQIGVRDEAKMLGGIGICGKTFCCSTFLDEFQPVSIKMAKTQSLSLNPAKISGTCGRLMCCLKYEQDAYEHLLKSVPKVGTEVECPEGKGVVTEVNLLKQRVKVRTENSNTESVFEVSELGEDAAERYAEKQRSKREEQLQAEDFQPIFKNVEEDAQQLPKVPGRNRSRDRDTVPEKEADIRKDEDKKAEGAPKKRRRHHSHHGKPKAAAQSDQSAVVKQPVQNKAQNQQKAKTPAQAQPGNKDGEHRGRRPYRGKGRSGDNKAKKAQEKPKN